MVVVVALSAVALITGTLASIVVMAEREAARSERAHSERLEQILREILGSSLTESEVRGHQRRIRALRDYERLVSDPYDGGF